MPIIKKNKTSQNLQTLYLKPKPKHVPCTANLHTNQLQGPATTRLQKTGTRSQEKKLSQMHIIPHITGAKIDTMKLLIYLKTKPSQHLKPRARVVYYSILNDHDIFNRRICINTHN